MESKARPLSNDQQSKQTAASADYIMQQAQVVIIGGFQHQKFDDYYPLLEGHCKHLLPINNKPLIAYQLEYLEKYGYQHAYVVYPNDENHSKLKSYLNQHNQDRIKAEAVPVDATFTEVQALSYLYEANVIKKDFILYGCDVLTTLNLDALLDYHVLSDSLLTLALKKERISKHETTGKVTVHDPSSTQDPEVYLLSDDNRVAHVQNYQDIKDDSQGLKIKKTLIGNIGSVQVRTDLFDTHVYMCKYEFIKLAARLFKKQKHMESFKQDLLPYLCSYQYNKKLRDLIFQVEGFEEDGATAGAPIAQRKNSYGVRNTSTELNKDHQFSTAVRAFIVENTYTRRLNNAEDYLLCNLDALKLQQQHSEEYEFFEPTDSNEEPRNILLDNADREKGIRITNCSIAKETTLDEGSTVNRCVIGRKVKIGKNTIIINSVLFNECTIGENCTIKDSIIGKKGAVLANCKLSKFRLQHHQKTLEGQEEQ